MLRIKIPGGQETKVHITGGFELVPDEVARETMRMIKEMDKKKTPAAQRPIIEITADNKIRLRAQA